MMMDYVVLGRLKRTSRLARRIPGSVRWREFYKLGIRNGFLYLLEDEDGGDAPPIVNRSDVACLYCLENGAVRELDADRFFKTYKPLLASRAAPLAAATGATAAAAASAGAPPAGAGV